MKLQSIILHAMGFPKLCPKLISKTQSKTFMPVLNILITF